MDPRIADYIRANRGRYTRESITKQLLEAGHDAGEIERTWVALDAPDADEVAGEGFWGRFALIVIGINLAVFLVVGLLTGMLTNLASGGVLLVILAIAMAIGALIAWAAVAATGPTKLSPRSALVIGAAIPALFAFLIGGTCYALVGSLGGVQPAGRPGQMDVELRGPLDVTQSVSAFCEPNSGDPADGVWVNGQIEVPGGSGNVSVGVIGGHGPVPDMVVSVFAEGPEDRPLSWASDMGPARPFLDVALDGFDGTVSFEDLPAAQDDPGGALGDPLAGTVSWTCE